MNIFTALILQLCFAVGLLLVVAGYAVKATWKHPNLRCVVIPAATLATAYCARYIFGCLLAGMAVGMVNDPGVDAGGEAFLRGDYQTAFKLEKPLADRGDAGAENEIGMLYEHGWGVTKNYAEAFEWYSKAAAQGNKDAQDCVAAMYAHGAGVKQSYVKAYFWYSISRDSDLLRDEAAKQLTPEQITDVDKRVAEWKPFRVSPAQ